jgi:hypothetical protein
MGWTILLYNSIGVYMQDESLCNVSNLTYNYSVPECMKYWYGPRDYDGKTVGEAMDGMRQAICAMFADGVLPLPYYAKETRENFQNSLLAWLISHSQQLSVFPKDWTVKLE